MASDDVGSRPSRFMIIPNTERHPDNTKTDQLPISELITGLPRPYHNIYLQNHLSGPFQLIDVFLSQLPGQLQSVDRLLNQLSVQFQLIDSIQNQLSGQIQLVENLRNQLSR